MSSTMSIIQTLFPEKLTGQGIQRVSAGAFRKNDLVYGNDTFQNQRVGSTFQLGGVPKMDRSGGVSGAVKILCS